MQMWTGQGPQVCMNNHKHNSGKVFIWTAYTAKISLRAVLSNIISHQLVVLYKPAKIYSTLSHSPF